MEKSDIIIQVVDARNPLLFRFPDLEVYAKEISPFKRVALLINKSDLLSEDMRKLWAEYFKSHNVTFFFFSAKLTQNAIDNSLEENKANKLTDIVGRFQLLQILEKEANEAAEDAGKDFGIVGMVGYPNVGKSSVINALLGAAKLDRHAHRVSVSATPGHTKHFQTMNIGNVTLCDCPGLVFPSFFNSKAEMLCNGILPIDEIRGREFIPAIDLLCERIPRNILEEEYKIKLDLPMTSKKATAITLLEAFCKVRGLHGQGPGRLDESRGARLLLKDFVNARLFYCHPPPGNETEADDDSDEQQGDEIDLQVNEASDLLFHTHLPVQSEDEVIYEAEKELKQFDELQNGPSRRLARHGRKHKKGRDKNPYEHDNAAFSAKVKGKAGQEGTPFTRKTGF